jgi:hypothetical protein
LLFFTKLNLFIDIKKNTLFEYMRIKILFAALSAKLCGLCASAFRKVHDVGPLLRIERSVYNTISSTLCADLFYRRGAKNAELRRGGAL